MRWGAVWLEGMLGALFVHALAQPAAADGRLGSTGERVVVSPVQGTDGVRNAYEVRLRMALERSLDELGFSVAPAGPSGPEVVACATPECTEAVLDRAGASVAVVPAMWVRSGGRRELTLTLVGKSGRNVNAGTVLNGDLSSTTTSLVRTLLAKRDAGSDTRAAPNAEWTSDASIAVGLDREWLDNRPEASLRERPERAWMAGPIAFWVFGAATFVAVGTVAAMKDDSQSLNGGALAGWLLLGGTAVAGGTTWWILGRRNRDPNAGRAALHVSPRGFDLRVGF